MLFRRVPDDMEQVLFSCDQAFSLEISQVNTSQRIVCAGTGSCFGSQSRATLWGLLKIWEFLQMRSMTKNNLPKAQNLTGNFSAYRFFEAPKLFKINKL